MIRISVITVTWNAARTLPALMDSLRAQTDRDFEWIVVDGASTDATPAQVSGAADLVTHWVSEPDFGVYHALNKALAMARGEYYLVLGSDDLLEAGAIGRYRRAATESGADIVSAPVWVDGRLTMPSGRLSWFSSRPPLVSAHSVGSLIRKALHDELGLYSRQLPIAADTLFLLRAWQAGKRFAYLGEPAGRFGSTGMSSNDVLGALAESMRAHVQVRGAWPLQLVLFVLRVLKNAGRIRRQARRGRAR